MLPWHPFACSISANRLPAIALSTGTTAAAATGTLPHRFRLLTVNERPTISEPLSAVIAALA
jgi:hypothetical protein